MSIKKLKKMKIKVVKCTRSSKFDARFSFFSPIRNFKNGSDLQQ